MSLLKLEKTALNDFDPRAEAEKIVTRLTDLRGLLEVYLFGSALSNQFSKDSDIDLMLIFKDMDSIQDAYKHLSKVQLSHWPVELVYKTKEDFDKRAHIGGVCFDVFHDGVKLYESK